MFLFGQGCPRKGQVGEMIAQLPTSQQLELGILETQACHCF